MTETAEVPLRTRDGSVRAVAIIDAADWPAVAQRRWWLSGKYPMASFQGRKVRLHRFLMGEPPSSGLEVDHRDQDPLNNRRSNLRWATRLTNRGNTGVHRGRDGLRGVYWTKGKWQAQACRNYQRYYLGRFDRQEDAAEAVRQFWAGIYASESPAWADKDGRS